MDMPRKTKSHPLVPTRREFAYGNQPPSPLPSTRWPPTPSSRHTGRSHLPTVPTIPEDRGFSPHVVRPSPQPFDANLPPLPPPRRRRSAPPVFHPPGPVGPFDPEIPPVPSFRYYSPASYPTQPPAVGPPPPPPAWLTPPPRAQPPRMPIREDTLHPPARRNVPEQQDLRPSMPVMPPPTPQFAPAPEYPAYVPPDAESPYVFRPNDSKGRRGQEAGIVPPVRAQSVFKRNIAYLTHQQDEANGWYDSFLYGHPEYAPDLRKFSLFFEASLIATVQDAISNVFKLTGGDGHEYSKMFHDKLHNFLEKFHVEPPEYTPPAARRVPSMPTVLPIVPRVIPYPPSVVVPVRTGVNSFNSLETLKTVWDFEPMFKDIDVIHVVEYDANIRLKNDIHGILDPHPILAAAYKSYDTILSASCVHFLEYFLKLSGVSSCIIVTEFINAMMFALGQFRLNVDKYSAGTLGYYPITPYQERSIPLLSEEAKQFIKSLWDFETIFDNAVLMRQHEIQVVTKYENDHASPRVIDNLYDNANTDYYDAMRDVFSYSLYIYFEALGIAGNEVGYLAREQILKLVKNFRTYEEEVVEYEEPHDLLPPLSPQSPA